MNTWIAWSLAALMTLGTAGCYQPQQPDQSAAVQTSARYSNLTDLAAQAEVAAALEQGGLSAQSVQDVLAWAQAYGASTGGAALPEGFSALPAAGADYSGIWLDDSAEAYTYLQWLNCRLTAYSLLKDQIHTAGTGSDTDVWLMFDIEALDTVPEFSVSAQQRADFITLFNQISVVGAETVAEQQARIEQAWRDREIRLDTEASSIICIYLHEPQDRTRFVGHTGVLTETEEGLLFVEKYSNLAPFQATYFRDRTELKAYLLARPDLYGDEAELRPIVTENGRII